MLDRVLITFTVVGGLGLLWLGWQYYKAKTIQTLHSIEVSANKPSLLYFTGKYCTACKFQQTPIIDSLLAKLGDSIDVKQYDVSDHPELASRYRVLTLPTTIVVNESGQVTHVNRGVARQDQLETQLLA